MRIFNEVITELPRDTRFYSGFYYHRYTLFLHLLHLAVISDKRHEEQWSVSKADNLCHAEVGGWKLGLLQPSQVLRKPRAS